MKLKFALLAAVLLGGTSAGAAALRGATAAPVVGADEKCGALQAASPYVSFGWGLVPVTVEIGRTGWTSSLFP